MESMILTILDMSLTAGCAAAVVIIVRQLLRRVPKKYSYLLWLVVAFRLICPFSFNSDISIFNLRMFEWAEQWGRYADGGKSAEAEYDYTKTQGADDAGTGLMYSAVSNQNASHGVLTGADMYEPDLLYKNVSNKHTSYGDISGNAASDKAMPGESLSVKTTAYPMKKQKDVISIVAFVWLSGMIVMAVYGTMSYVLLKRKLKKALKIKENIYRSNRISTPFVMGFVQPKIYIPCFLDNKSMEYVIAHEKCHIKRLDYIVKLLSFLLLCIHWFNPLIWAAFILMEKDMEMSCDEMVLEKMTGRGKKNSGDTSDINKDYSYALLCCASAGRFPAPGSLCFGDISVKGRIKNVLNYRKPRKFMTAAAIILCMAVLAACSANPKNIVSADNTFRSEGTVLSAEAASEQPENNAAGSVAADKSVDDRNTDDIIFDACVTYHMDPQEVSDLLKNASDKDKISPYTQCKMYSEAELDEWVTKMAAYYGDGWHTRMSGDSIVNVVNTGTVWYKYELAGYDADIVPSLDLKPVYPVPVDDAKITAGYGYIKSELASGFHFEDDFSVEQGSNVKAVADGKVVLAGLEGSHGISVVTQNDDGYMTSYYHLSTANVNVGDTVAAGDVIGQSGQSGDAAGPMLSFAVSYYDEETGINFIEPAYLESPYTELDIEYTKNPDGTYSYDGNTYEYKLQVAGYERNEHVTYVVLTNDLDTDFDAVLYSLIGAERHTGEPEFVILGWY